MNPGWPDRYGRALSGRAAAAVDADDGVQEAVLDLARVVAHLSQRKHAPLATFLAGQFVAIRSAAGVPASVALAEAAEVAQVLLDGDSGE